MNSMASFVGGALARFLSRPLARYRPLAISSLEALAATLQPADVLLVEGDTRVSTAIKFLTQSTWSHAALYVGEALGTPSNGAEPAVLVEADMVDGVRAVPLSTYAGLHTRICRPVGLRAEDARRVIEYAVSRLGDRYDLRNVIDLVRYLLSTPPVPTRWRRRMLALGSGDPTRAICSTLIAQAFQSVRYPILPHVIRRIGADPRRNTCEQEVLHIRHHSLFAPRDFDISPYFQVVKPAIESGFDYRELVWDDQPPPGGALASAR